MLKAFLILAAALPSFGAESVEKCHDFTGKYAAVCTHIVTGKETTAGFEVIQKGCETLSVVGLGKTQFAGWPKSAEPVWASEFSATLKASNRYSTIQEQTFLTLEQKGASTRLNYAYAKTSPGNETWAGKERLNLACDLKLKKPPVIDDRVQKIPTH